MKPRSAVVVVPVGSNTSGLDIQLKALAEQSLRLPVILSVNATEVISPVRTIAEAYSDVTVVDTSSERGPSYARQRGAEYSDAEIILYCDADDRVDREWTTELLSAMHDSDYAGGPLEYKSLNPPGFHRFQHDWSTGPAVKWGYLPFFPSANFAISRAALKAVGGWDMNLAAAEDTDICWRAATLGFRGSFAPSAVVAYRLRTTVIDTFRQAFGYGKGDAALLRKHQFSIRRSGWKLTISVGRAFLTLRHVTSASGRNLIASAFGTALGHLLETTKRGPKHV